MVCDTWILSSQRAKLNAHDEPVKKTPARLVIRNIGLLLSGDLEQPILDADTVVAVDGKITAVGKQKGHRCRRRDPDHRCQRHHGGARD